MLIPQRPCSNECSNEVNLANAVNFHGHFGPQQTLVWKVPRSGPRIDLWVAPGVTEIRRLPSYLSYGRAQGFSYESTIRRGTKVYIRYGQDSAANLSPDRVERISDVNTEEKDYLSYTSCTICICVITLMVDCPVLRAMKWTVAVSPRVVLCKLTLPCSRPHGQALPDRVFLGDLTISWDDLGVNLPHHFGKYLLWFRFSGWFWLRIIPFLPPLG